MEFLGRSSVLRLSNKHFFVLLDAKCSQERANNAWIFQGSFPVLTFSQVDINDRFGDVISNIAMCTGDTTLQCGI